MDGILYTKYLTEIVMENLIIIITIIFYIVFGVFSTYKVRKSDCFDKMQKFIQVLLIWLVPIIGAGFILLLYTSFDDPHVKGKTFGGGASSSSNIDGSHD